MTRHTLCLVLLLPLGLLHAADKATNTPAAIPWNQIGAKAGADYKGDGLTVTPTPSGAQLHCIFQRLDGEATPDGLWLTSTVPNAAPDRFRVTATAIGRTETPERGSVSRSNDQTRDSAPFLNSSDERLETSFSPSWVYATQTPERGSATRSSNQTLDDATSSFAQLDPADIFDPLWSLKSFTSLPSLDSSLPPTGAISLSAQTVRFTRPGLTEEYTVSMDGLRQDFIVEEPPEAREASWSAPALWRFSPSHARTSQLLLTLSVTGARVEPAPDGARLVLQNSGRQIAYTRLRVTDATGKELSARIEVNPVGDEVTSLKSSDLLGDNSEVINPLSLSSAANPQIVNRKSNIVNLLSILINDTDATYPLRIDPTFSDANWISMGGVPGANGTVYAEVTDGSGNLYVGGNFTTVANINANCVAKWNGSSWSPLGSGIIGAYFTVNALAVSGSTLYAGGYFTNAGGSPANYIAKWNGTNWSALSSGLGPVSLETSVAALAVSGSTLYVGGYFTTAGGNPANAIAKWNGTNWSALGSGMGTDGQVNALAVSGTTVYAGGAFSPANGGPGNSVAKWNGTNWSALGSGISQYYVFALAVSGSTLYAGGFFTNAGGIAANNIAKWDGTNWSALGLGTTGTYPYVYALAAVGSNLYVGGEFTIAGGSAASCIAQWNGANWSALGSGVNTSVMALAASGSTLYAGGYFTTASTNAANYVAKWNGNNWSAVATGSIGLNNDVFGLAVSGGILYAGGAFTTAGGTTANYIAQWNGVKWSALGSGVGSTVFALAMSSNVLYAGGGFTNAGGISASYIAQWDGTNWSALGSGMDSYVYALAVSNNTLYAGGFFTNAGGRPVNCVAQWDGSNWLPLGSGISGISNQFSTGVYTMAVSGGTLYAGGTFTNAGGSAANNMAQWNGINWLPLSSGMNGKVSALTMSGNLLYAGGTFTTAGGNAANNIAQWNGSVWSPLSSGVLGMVDGYGPSVNALAVSGSLMYAGGVFTNAGGIAANSTAQWNGTNWSPLGSGLSGIPYPMGNALALCGSILYVGGTFTTAGTNISAYVAQAILPIPLSILTTDGNFGFTNGYFGFDISGPPNSNVVIQTSTDLQTWLPLQTNTLNPSGLLYFSDTQSPANTQRFYNVVLP